MSKNTGNVRMKVTARRVRSTIVAVEEQECVRVWLAKRMRRIVCQSVACLAVLHFSSVT